MSDIDPEVGKVLRECGLGNDAVWKHKQSGKYIVYHWALERAAAKKGVKFDTPLIVAADPAGKIATILVNGHLDDREEWSFGEAAPYNTQQTYPFAMAEKRAKDRVILKLIGLHGLAYSEEEADDFKQSAPAEQELTPAQKAFNTIRQNLINAPNDGVLENVWADSEEERKKLPPAGQAALMDVYHKKKAQAA